MELVYLWVEDYKNIQKQGFNFSPRFKCEYNEKSNELTIDEDKEYVSIFPENINVTAIVGENGSGKSSICGELYAEIIQKELKKKLYKEAYIFVFFYDKEYYVISNNLNIQDNKKIVYSSFLELERDKNIAFFVALGEFNTRENHKGGEIVDSKYSILPLRRKELIDSETLDIQEKILNKIQANYNQINIKNSGRNKVLFNQNIPLGRLSFGEKYRISLYSQIYNRLKEQNNAIIFLDEVTLSLHPSWQKSFINDLILICKDFNVHFITSSHSPFILSDLPKENVIFLEKGKQVDVDIETFGANIHTLLSHGFFMKDGLMGEFAKGEINKAITKLNQSKLSKDDIKFCENIIKITGEPIIKRQMQKMLDSKRLSKIDTIEKQITKLQEELQKMKK